QDGKVDPADVHVDGVPTEEEERQMEELRRRKRLDLIKRDQENRERRKKEEKDKWWRGAELLYGERQNRSGAVIFKESVTRDECDIIGKCEPGDPGDSSCSTRFLSDEEQQRLKDRYSMEYSRWDKWTPTDPATLAEVEEREEEEDQKRSKEFEKSNPEFCKKMVDDMKARSEARDEKDSASTAARLKGNRFYKAKLWEKALDLYMTSLRARPYAVNTLANIAQTMLKLERWLDAVEFCDRALHVDGKCVKALSRRAAAFVKLAGKYSSNSFVSVNASATTRTAAATATGSPRYHLVGRPDGHPAALINDESYSGGDRKALATTGTGGKRESGAGNRIDRREPGEFMGEDVLHASYGGREGLMASALHDLDAAVNVDVDNGDIRRQRDNLKKEIDEEKAEAGVMGRVRNGPGNLRARRLPTDDLFEPGKEDLVAPINANPSGDCGASPLRQDFIRTGAGRADDATPIFASKTLSRDGAVAARDGCSFQGAPTGVEGDLREIDSVLHEALGDGGEMRQPSTLFSTAADRVEAGNGAPPQLPALLRLSSILEGSSTARVYLRASGGLGRLAAATVTAFAAIAANYSDTDDSGGGSLCETEEKASAAEIGPTSSAAAAGGAECASTDTLNNPRAANSSGAGCSKSKPTGVIQECEGDRERFASMLGAVSVALKGEERLAQQDVFHSGLLGDPCARAMQARHEGDQEDSAKSSAAGAAALLLSRVVEDVSIRTYVAKDEHLLSGLIGLIRAQSTPSRDVQAAASALRAVLIGCTATIAARTLSRTASTSSAMSTPTGQTEGRIAGWPTTAVGEALLAWRNGSGLMKDAPFCTGSALCSVLANLAMNENFRGTFAEPFIPRSRENKGQASTVAAVLVLVAGNAKADHSEARTVALAALVNACLHNHRVQTATLDAGGLALALATLSLRGDDRARYAPPLVAARSAGLLARLAPLPAALEAMTRRGVFDRIVEATVQNSTLGGDLYTSAALTHHKGDSTVDAITPSAAKTAAHAIERENLVRALGSILRSRPRPTSPAAGNGPPAPSSNVPAPVVVLAKDNPARLVVTAERAKLASTLVSFLPPAREDGVEGVTPASVPLRPKWSAPPAVTANVCVCLLHLLGGERSDHIADQVVAAGGISHLISLFANSGGEGGAISARTNAAICLARLARKPRHKQ
ncbi:unnamed protein product, partial [Scytosiphon promiscuus]